MEELVYTSAPQGLVPGTTGFCTVEMTEGTPTEIMESLESLSAYDHDPAGTVNWMHVRLQTMREMRHVMSRIGPLQGEFSGRSNKLAHHICLAADELPPQGPMQIVGRGGPLQAKWSGQVRKLPPQPPPQHLRAGSLPRVCQTWASATGDAGVAGAVLARLRRSPTAPLWLIRTPSMDALAMTDELLAMLPGPQRWEITFCTYLHPLPRRAQCQLRWVLPASPAMQQLRDLGPDQLMDLRGGTEAMLAGADPAFVEAARKGTAIVEDASRAGPRKPSTTRGTVSRQRAATAVDLGDPVFDSTPASASELPPPPPAQHASPWRWPLIAAAIVIVPACALVAWLSSRDRAPMAAVNNMETPVDTVRSNQNTSPEFDRADREAPSDRATEEADSGPRRVTSPAIEAPAIETPAIEAARIEAAVGQQPPPVPSPQLSATVEAAGQDPTPPLDPKQGKLDPILDKQTVAIKPPSSALTLSVDTQTLFQGSGIAEVELTAIAPMYYAIQFQLTPADSSGARDLRAVATATGEQRKMGTLYTEPDRVLFAWAPDTGAGVAAAFILAHEFLIKDDTHHTTLLLELAQPVTVSSPVIPGPTAEISIPAWVLPEFECWAIPTVFSSVSSQGIQFRRFAIQSLPPAGDPPWHTMRQDLSALQDPAIDHALISVAGEVIGSAPKRLARISTRLELGGQDEPFPWSSRARVIGEQVAKYNSKIQNQRDAKPMNSARRKKIINQWGESLRCDLELYARINGRDILWGKSEGARE